MRKFIVFLATFWVIIYSNARMLDFVPTYNVVHIFPIPQPVRTLELLLMILLYAMSLTTKMTGRMLAINICLLIFLGISLASLLFGQNLGLSGIQDIYIRLVPYLFFVIVAQASRSSRAELMFFVKFFTIVLFLNILIAVFYQIPFYGYYEDNINGFLEDAHLFANYLAIFSVVCFYDFTKTKRPLSLFLSILLMVISIYPRNEKVLFLNILIILFLLVRSLIRMAGKRYRIYMVGALASLVVAGIIYLQQVSSEKEALRRANIALNTIGVENIGPVIAWPMAFNEIKTSPLTLFYGLGAGQYGWIAASRSVAEGKGSVHSKLFEFEFAPDNTQNAGFLFRTNTWSSLLAEYGIAGTIAFLIPLILILKSVVSFKTNDRLEKNLKIAIYTSLLIVVFQGFFTPYSNWSAFALMLPTMYIAAYFQQRPAAKEIDDGEKVPLNELPPGRI